MRPIDADKAREEATIDLVVHHLDRQPTLDYKDFVPQGEWERVIPSKSAVKWSTKVSCSVCHKGGYERYNFCPNCGTKIEFLKEKIVEEDIQKVEVEVEDVQKTNYREFETREEKHARRKEKAYSAIAKVGYGLGIGTFASSFVVPGMLFLGVGAIILCSFGKKSKTSYQKARVGWGLSLAGLIINTVLTAILL